MAPTTRRKRPHASCVEDQGVERQVAIHVERNRDRAVDWRSVRVGNHVDGRRPDLVVQIERLAVDDAAVRNRELFGMTAAPVVVYRVVEESPHLTRVRHPGILLQDGSPAEDRGVQSVRGCGSHRPFSVGGGLSIHRFRFEILDVERPAPVADDDVIELIGAIRGIESVLIGVDSVRREVEAKTNRGADFGVGNERRVSRRSGAVEARGLRPNPADSLVLQFHEVVERFAVVADGEVDEHVAARGRQRDRLKSLVPVVSVARE